MAVEPLSIEQHVTLAEEHIQLQDTFADAGDRNAMLPISHLLMAIALMMLEDRDEGDYDVTDNLNTESPVG